MISRTSVRLGAVATLVAGFVAVQQAPAEAKSAGSSASFDDRKVVQLLRPGAERSKGGLALHMTSKDAVSAGNAAVATSSCDGCHATAISFQVVVADKSPTSIESQRRLRQQRGVRVVRGRRLRLPVRPGLRRRRLHDVGRSAQARADRSGAVPSRAVRQLGRPDPGRGRRVCGAGRRHPFLRAAGAPGGPQGRPEAARSRTEVVSRPPDAVAS